jgi:hypothetical protein
MLPSIWELERKIKKLQLLNKIAERQRLHSNNQVTQAPSQNIDNHVFYCPTYNYSHISI